MKIFNVSSGDEMGGRWNGFDAIEPLKTLGVSSKIGAFWNQTSEISESVNLFPGPGRRAIAELVRGYEVVTGRQSTYQFWSRKIFELPEFKEADLIHLQVVNDHLLTVESIVEISKSKPTVWTWHDLWPLTGHCIFPGTCQRWAKGCGDCPSLDSPLEVLWDRTKLERQRKRDAFSSTQLNVHVTTDWMRKKVGDKISGWNTKMFQFPFGIDTKKFHPGDKTIARNFFGIDPQAFVVAARATDDGRKGFIELVKGLEKVVDSGRAVLLLTLQQQGLVSKISERVRSIELPWTNDRSNLAMFYRAADVFAMPSSSETFGMMTLEAMACGVPVITVEGTASSEVASCVDLEVQTENLVENLANKISFCFDNPESIVRSAKEARARAESVFSLEAYLSNLTGMYEEVIDEHHKS